MSSLKSTKSGPSLAADGFGGAGNSQIPASPTPAADMDRSEPGEQLLIKEHSESECAAIEVGGCIEIADPDDSTSHGRHYDTPNRMVCRRNASYGTGNRL